MSQYPMPPPAYGASGSAPKINTSSRDETREPLLGSPSHSGGGGIFDQPEAGDVPDDFKVRLFASPLRLCIQAYCISVRNHRV
jgi:hypothetical protein